MRRRFRFSVEGGRGRRVIAVRGRLRSRDGGRLHDALLDEQIRGAEEIVIDLTAVDYFDSEVVELMLGWRRSRQLAGQTLHIVGLDAAADRMFDSWE